MFPQLDLLIEKIAAAAAGEADQRAQAEAILRRMARQGWGLEPAVQRLWAGERDPARLTEGLDDPERQVILDVLGSLELSGEAPSELPEEVGQALAGLPEPLQGELRAALLQRDTTALQDAYQAALERLTPEQDARLRQALAGWASQDGPLPTQAERRELLDSLPEGVRLAVLEQDAGALQTALNALPPEQAGELLDRLVQAGFFAEAEQQALAQTVAELEPALQAIAAAAGDPAMRLQMEDFLVYLEGHGLHLRPAISALWDGERDPVRLSAGLGEQERWIVQRLVGLVGEV